VRLPLPQDAGWRPIHIIASRMPTRQPASFNAPSSRIAASRAACLPLGGATREKALFILRPELTWHSADEPTDIVGRSCQNAHAESIRDSGQKAGVAREGVTRVRDRRLRCWGLRPPFVWSGPGVLAARRAGHPRRPHLLGYPRAARPRPAATPLRLLLQGDKVARAPRQEILVNPYRRVPAPQLGALPSIADVLA
jgi:hypothetical protein